MLHPTSTEMSIVASEALRARKLDAFARDMSSWPALRGEVFPGVMRRVLPECVFLYFYMETG